MTRIHWVRHAPTHQRRLVGHWDAPADFSDEAALAALAASLPPTAPIVSSDLSRASGTADRIAGGRERLPDDAGLREFDFGLWDRLTFPEISASHPDLSRRFWGGESDARPPQGESWSDLSARIGRALEPYLARGDADLVIVAHFGVILTQIARIGKLDTATTLSHRIDNLSTTSLRYGKSPGIISINRPPK